ncbi:MAG: DUF6049 family protein [Actinomycetota bacterium]
MMCRRFMVACVVCATLLSLAAGGAHRAVAQENVAGVSARMNAFYYGPGDRAYLDVDLELSVAARADDLYLELLVYPPASMRSQLASFREGTRRYAMVTRDLETITPESEWTNKMYEVDLNSLGLKAGVYPFEVRLLQDGETISADQNFLVIMDPAAGLPLNLSTLWSMDFLPYTDAQGNELDTGLASACSSSPDEPGFLYGLVQAMKKTPEVRSNLVLANATYDDIAALAEASGKDGSGYEEEGASAIIADLEGSMTGGAVELVGTTYSFADPDALASQAWENPETGGSEGQDDATRQVQLGLDFLEEMASGSAGFVAPLFRLSDPILQRLVSGGVEFTVVGREALEASAAGKRLLEGATLSQPVRFVSSEGYTLKAFVRDETLYTYLESAQGMDATHVIQNIFAELAVLQRERPYAVRSCVLAFPSTFMPPPEFLNDLYTAIKGCPWLQTRLLSELSTDQAPLEGVALQSPVYTGAATDYMQELQAVREDIADFTASIPADHPMQESLGSNQLVAENYRFTTGRDSAAAQAYLGSIDALIRGETAKVTIEQKRSVTLSGTEGKLSVDVTSSLDYPLRGVTLRLDNASLIFPQGSSMQVTVEPRENRYIFDVDTRRKGSFIVDIVLETGDLVIANTSTTVNTSIINTLAIVLLVCLAVIVAVAVLTRRLVRRYRGGKHSKGRAKA